ncbi:thiamine phosphate synthase [Candidatus Pelagibacter sp.]|uniref:thiamine phosphate synthase n=1 Tax=Candidatus Pelagibacter sp. TaxID=2024849 RepID=UPI003F82B190
MQLNKFKVYYFVSEFNLTDLSQLSRNINIIYRNYKNTKNLETVYKLKRYCKKNGHKLYISNNFKLSIKLGLNGVYIPSFNKKINFVQNYCLPKNFKIIGSAHNTIEINLKIKQKCSEIFLSPIFKVNKSKNFLGIIKFNNLTLNNKINFIALGGICDKNFKLIKLLSSKGFASINWAKKNGLRELRPFII